MYRNEDLIKINEKIDMIKDESFKEYKTNYEPTLEENSKVYKAILNYIKKNNLLIYGGFAQNLLVKIKNPQDTFYKDIDGVFFNWPEVADIEIYSPTPMEDAMKLSEELFKDKFKNIDSQEGINEGTFKIFVNFVPYADISYMPYNIYNNMPIINVQGFRLVHPHFMLCDAFRIFTDPLTSYWRLDKSIDRFQKIIKYYPIDLSQNDKKIELNGNTDILHFIRHKIIHNSKLIVVGFYAFNYYVKKYSNQYLLNNFPYYELISSDLDNDSINILNILKTKYGNNIIMKKFCPFFDFIDKRMEYYHNNKMILRLFGNNERCIVYRYSQKKLTYFGTFNLVLMYLLFIYNLAYVNSDSKNKDLYLALIGKLYVTRNNYLSHHKITVVDESPFQDFTFKCLGKPRDPKRTAFLERKEKKKQGKKIIWRYTPSGKPIQTQKYNFENCSGNEIKNKK